MSKPTKLLWRPGSDQGSSDTSPGDVSPDKGDACLVQIYPTGPGMGACYILGDSTSVIGRDPECDIRIRDKSVSRRHARVEFVHGEYSITDLDSTNGTYVNDQRVSSRLLKDGDYLHVGNAIFRYLAGGNVEAAYHEEIYRLTIIDGLTGIHNKRYFLETLEHELARSSRYNRPLTLILFDLDKFKAINDQWGHLCGDFTLRELAQHVARAIRKEDVFARYGGEEFALLMPETPLKKAVPLAERLRKLVEAQTFTFDGRQLHVTISMGVVTTQGDTTMNVNEFIRLADEKLYKAKFNGRNRVEA
jgi:diguanylate cyclase (GGDEF)-like protein